MSHWVGVSKGLCEINWKNVTHLVRASAQPRSKISLKEALATFSDALALSVWEAETFVLWLPWKIWSGEVADDQLAKLELLCKLIARLPTTLSQHIWQVLPGKILNDFNIVSQLLLKYSKVLFLMLILTWLRMMMMRLQRCKLITRPTLLIRQARGRAGKLKPNWLFHFEHSNSSLDRSCLNRETLPTYIWVERK